MSSDQVVSVPGVERPRLELSGPKLARALEILISGSEESGGIERYVDALKLKSQIYRVALGGNPASQLTLETFQGLCACMPTVRRRIGPHLLPGAFGQLRSRAAALLEERTDTVSTDARIAAFCAAFPDDRSHRWVRDLGAELLHNLDPERYPLMCRWVWDARANTGVLREIWHAEDVDHMVIQIPDGYGTFVALREELARYLSDNGVFRDVMQYVDLLTAQVYAGYISEQGGSYLRTDFATPEEPMIHVRRLLGLDAVSDTGRSRLKRLDGDAVVAESRI
ncbi:MAG TPA: hypothetical protein VFP00_00105, partial [Burkholderiales bacterium]|nr:hypothetical protein [Burkholderiales bacterium]